MPIVDGVETGFISRFALRADALQWHTIKVKDLFFEVAAAVADYVRNSEDLSAALPIACTIDHQPDVPRSLAWALTHANITAFSLAVAGISAKGAAVTETYTEVDGWSGETDAALATITSITLSARTGTGVGDFLNIGVGSRLGLANSLAGSAGVYKVTKNKDDYPAASYTVDVGNNTIDVSTGAAIVDGDDFAILYEARLDGYIAQ